jgi:hypothetical protein
MLNIYVFCGKHYAERAKVEKLFTIYRGRQYGLNKKLTKKELDILSCFFQIYR